MRIAITSALALLPLLLTPVTTTSLTLLIPPSPNLANPSALPPSTHASLTTLGTTLRAPLTKDNTFVFQNLSTGSYLADVYCPTHSFAPLRVDVEGDGVRVWETFRGNDWGNRGEEIMKKDGNGGEKGGEKVYEVRGVGVKGFFGERGGFSIFSILKNPMILMGLVSLGLFIGMPKLMENMDPEMRAEFEEQQKKNPMNSLMGGSAPGSAGGFDMAGFLAGQERKPESGDASSSGTGSGNSHGSGSGNGNGNGNGGKRSGKR